MLQVSRATKGLLDLLEVKLVAGSNSPVDGAPCSRTLLKEETRLCSRGSTVVNDVKVRHHRDPGARREANLAARSGTVVRFGVD